MNVILLFVSLSFTFVVVNSAAYGQDVGAQVPPLAISDNPFTVFDSSNNTASTKRPILTKYECGRTYNTDYYNRIVGGEIAAPGENPWLVSIQVRYPGYLGKHICGGAILNERWMITAAHCLNDLDLSIIEIVAGDYNLYKAEGNEQRRTVSLLVTNSFNENNFARDIALVRVSKRFNFNRFVSPICLPAEGERFYNEGTISGWGRTSEFGITASEVHKVTVPFVSMSKCTDTYTRLNYQHYLSGCQICAGLPEGGRDACQGDSGGPMICRKGYDNKYYLCGVVSWGIGCARPGLPGVYTEISCYSDWIQSIIYNRNNILGWYARKERKIDV